jgi:hypothetical protein
VISQVELLGKDKTKFAPHGNFTLLVENGIKACLPPANFFAGREFLLLINNNEKNLLKI